MSQPPDTRKVLSQNFLRPGPVVRRLVSAASVSPDDLVVEIGGGSGVLTRELERTGCRLVVVEKDPRYATLLKSEYADHTRVHVVQTDVDRFRWPEERFRVLANIPFGQTTSILRSLLNPGRESLARADLIVQLDVARKRARPATGNKLNLLWAQWWTMELVQRLDRNVFEPLPRVDAGVLSVRRRNRPLLPTEEALLWSGLLDLGFQRAREPIRRALRAVLTGVQFHRAATQHQLRPSEPASRLTLEEWLTLHRVVRDHVPPERWPMPKRIRARGPRARRAV